MKTAEKVAVVGTVAAASLGLAYALTRPSSGVTPPPAGTPANIVLSATVNGYLVTFSVLITDMNGTPVPGAGSAAIGNGWDFGIPPTAADGTSSTQASFPSGTYSATGLTQNGIQSVPINFTV